MGNTTLADRVVTRFLSDMPQQLLALSAALDRADSKSARLTAHAIKGAAANVGGLQLRNVARELERLGESGNMQAAAELVPQLTLQWERFRNQTESAVSTPGGPTSSLNH